MKILYEINSLLLSVMNKDEMNISKNVNGIKRLTCDNSKIHTMSSAGGKNFLE